MPAHSPRILHCLRDGSQVAELAPILIGLGFEAEHLIALGDSSASFDRTILRTYALKLAQDFPDFSGSAGPGRLIAIGHALTQYDLVVTYGWGTINVAMAHKVFGQHLGLPPLIHHEPGSPRFEELEKRLKRKIIRRIAFGSVTNLIVPPSDVANFAKSNWNVPAGKIIQFRTGIDLKRFKPTAKPDALAGLVKRSTEHWIGAELTPDRGTAANELVRALKHLPRDWHLVLMAGETSPDAVRAAADAEEQSHRVHVLGSSADESAALALCDLFVDLSGPYEASSLRIKAMAAATPVVDFGAGDIVTTLESLIENAEMRKQKGAENRKHALANFDFTSSVKVLGGIYLDAIRA